MTWGKKGLFRNSSAPVALFLLAAPLICARSDQPQEGTTKQVLAPSVAPQIAVNYPDNVNGLKQLASDILRAQKENKPARASELLESLLLPNFREWYAENFSEPAVIRAVPAYAASAPRLSAQLAQIFLGAQQEGFHGIEAVRYADEQSACSSPPIFSVMTARRTQVPLYELRFTHGDRFKRVSAFAYVDGAFRLILIPDLSHPASQTPQRPAESGPKDAEAETRVHMGAIVQAARIVCRVQPYYPEEARRAHISGTVRLHAIIGRDGSIQQLDALSGPDVLATAAKFAVRQWRYRPVMLNGEPVEVDTTIDVIFSLNYP